MGRGSGYVTDLASWIDLAGGVWSDTRPATDSDEILPNLDRNVPRSSFSFSFNERLLSAWGVIRKWHLVVCGSPMIVVPSLRLALV